jgi:hypothetical protein
MINPASASAPLLGCLVFMQQAIAETSCNESAGTVKAHRLVAQCFEVSPATHPPCNAANACVLIEDEIRRGCMLLGKLAPAICAPYRKRG